MFYRHLTEFHRIRLTNVNADNGKSKENEAESYENDSVISLDTPMEYEIDNVPNSDTPAYVCKTFSKVSVTICIASIELDMEK